MGRLHPIPPPSTRDGLGGPRIPQPLLLSQLPPHQHSWLDTLPCLPAVVLAGTSPWFQGHFLGWSGRRQEEQTGSWEKSGTPIQQRCGTARVALEATKWTLSGNSWSRLDRGMPPFVISPLFPWGHPDLLPGPTILWVRGVKGFDVRAPANSGGWRGRGKCIYFSQGIV